MPEESENKNPLLGEFSNSLSDILGPEKSDQLALTEEALRMASGGTPDKWDQMGGDLWLSRALRFAFDALDGNFDFEADSLQNRLLHQLHAKNSHSGVWEHFRIAQEDRRQALRDIASRALTGKSYEVIRKQIGESAKLKVTTLEAWTSVDPETIEIPEIFTPLSKSKTVEGCSAVGLIDYREFALLRLAFAIPEKVLPSDQFRTSMNLALMSGRGSQLFSAIAREHARTTKAKKSLGIDLNEIVMTMQWVNPDFPLWLATENALAAILRGVFDLEDITENGARKMRNRKLLGAEIYPILGFISRKDGSHEFRLDRGLSAG